MKCPILVASAITHTKKIEMIATKCGKEECAWWDKEHDMCRHCTIAEELSSIQWELQELREMIYRKITS